MANLTAPSFSNISNIPNTGEVGTIISLLWDNTSTATLEGESAPEYIAGTGTGRIAVWRNITMNGQKITTYGTYYGAGWAAFAN